MSTNVEISKRLVFINSASSVAARLINISVLVWLHQYLLRRISPEEYSLYPVLMGVVVFVPLLTVILSSGLGRYIVEAYAKGNERQVTQIVSTMFPLLLGAGVLVLALGWTFAWHVGRILTIAPDRLWDARIMMALLLFSAAIRLPLAPFGVGMYVRQKFVLSNCIGLCIQILRIALLLILLLGISTRVLWVVVASVSANLCNLLVTVIISCRLIPALKFQPSQIRWSLAKPLTSFGACNLVLELTQIIRAAIDPIILNKLATPLDVTCYHLGSLPLRQIQQGTGTATAPLQPVLTAIHAVADTRKLQKAYLCLGKYALWAGLVLALPLMVYAKEIILLYVGSEYLSAATVMMLMLSLIPLGYGNMMLSRLAHAKAQMRPLALRVVLAQVGKLMLTVYLVGYIGLGSIGAALASFFISVFSQALLMIPLGLKMAKISLRTWLAETIWPGFLPGLAATGIMMVLKTTLAPSSWTALCLCVACGGLCYIAVLFTFCLRQDERDDLFNLMRKIGSQLLVLRRSQRNKPQVS